MKLIDSVLYNMVKSNKRIPHLTNIKEVAAFLLGVMSVASLYQNYDEKGENFWISDFEEYVTNYLNAELNNFNDEWEETIGTSYPIWIYNNQKSDEDGLKIFYKLFEEYSINYLKQIV